MQWNHVFHDAYFVCPIGEFILNLRSATGGGGTPMYHDVDRYVFAQWHSDRDGP